MDEWVGLLVLGKEPQTSLCGNPPPFRLVRRNYHGGSLLHMLFTSLLYCGEHVFLNLCATSVQVTAGYWLQ